MKKICCFLVLVIISISLSSCGNTYNTNYNTEEFFGKTMGGIYSIPDNIENNIPEEEIKAVFEKDMNVYTVQNIENTEERIQKLLSAFGMEDATLKVVNDTLYYSVRTSSGYKAKELDVYPNGRYAFHDNTVGSDHDILSKKMEIRKIVEDFAKEKDLLPNEYISRGYMSSGGADDSCSSYGPRFASCEDGYRIYGFDDILTEYGGDGICTFVSRCYNHTYLTTVKTASMEQALKALVCDGANVEFGEGYLDTRPADRVVLTGVESVYYNNGISGYLVPCYLFKGIAYWGEVEAECNTFVISIPRAEDYILSPR